MRPAAWGVDLTGGAVRAVHLERRGSRYQIVDVIDQPYTETGEGAEPLRAHLADAVGRALTDLLQSRRSTLADPLFVALPTIGAKHGRVEVPVADPARAPALLQFELHQVIASDLEPWLVRTSRPQSNGRGGLVADFFAQQRDLVKSFVGDVRRFGLPLDGLVAGPLALARYAELEWPVKGRRLVIECCRTRTDLLYLSEFGARWRTLPYGCGMLSDAAAPSQQPSDVEVARFAARLASEHREAHRALFGAHDGTALERVVLLGDAARQDSLRRALSEELHLEVSVPHAPRHFITSTSAGAHHPLHFGTAIGLAVAALDRGGEPWSLVTPPRARITARRLPAWSGALLLLSLGLTATRFGATRELQTLESQVGELRQRTRWSAGEEWDAAQALATAADERTRAIIGAAARTRQLTGFPSRLLQVLSDPEVFYRLVSLQLVPGEPSDEARLVFEVENGLPGAAETIREFLAKRAGLAVTGVSTEKREDGALIVSLQAALVAPADGA